MVAENSQTSSATSTGSQPIIGDDNLTIDLSSLGGSISSDANAIQSSSIDNQAAAQLTQTDNFDLSIDLSDFNNKINTPTDTPSSDGLSSSSTSTDVAVQHLNDAPVADPIPEQPKIEEPMSIDLSKLAIDIPSSDGLTSVVAQPEPANDTNKDVAVQHLNDTPANDTSTIDMSKLSLEIPSSDSLSSVVTQPEPASSVVAQPEPANDTPEISLEMPKPVDAVKDENRLEKESSAAVDSNVVSVVSSPAVNNYNSQTSTTPISNGGLNLSAITMDKVKEKESQQTIVQQPSGGLDLDSMISQMGTPIQPVQTGFITSQPMLQPTSQPNIMSQQMPPQQMPIADNYSNPISNPAASAVLTGPMPTQPVQTNSYSSQDASQETIAPKTSKGKLVLLIVLLPVLMGFLLKTMYPDQFQTLIVDNLNNIMGGSGSKTEIVQVTPVDMNSTTGDQNLGTGLQTGSGDINGFVATTTGDNSALSGHSAAGLSGEAEFDPFSGLGDPLTTGKAENELMETLNTLMEEGNKYLEQGKLTNDKMTIRSATILVKKTEKEIAGINSGIILDDKTMQEHIDLLKTYLDKLQSTDTAVDTSKDESQSVSTPPIE